MLVPGEWESMPEFTHNRDDFQHCIYNIFFRNPKNTVTSCKLILPNYVTVQERHRIHKFTTSGMDAYSFGEYPNRVMEIDFTKKYMQNIYDTYYVEPEEPEHTVEIDTPLPDHELAKMQAIRELKKAILDDVMTLIDKHLSDEFLKYYN